MFVLRAMNKTPYFFVALAHTDTIAYLNSSVHFERKRVSNLNLFPNSLKENLLFSMSFDSRIHYDTWSSNLDPIASSKELEKEDSLPTVFHSPQPASGRPFSTFSHFLVDFLPFSTSGQPLAGNFYFFSFSIFTFGE